MCDFNIGKILRKKLENVENLFDDSHGVAPSADSLILRVSIVAAGTPGRAGKSLPFISNSGARKIRN